LPGGTSTYARAHPGLAGGNDDEDHDGPRYLDDGWTYFSLKALIAMKTEGVRPRVEPYLHDANAMVRKLAQRAMKALPD
jgi:hypothetical protein